MVPAKSPNLRHLLLPREHGAWSLALEPVALGLLAAPSRAGAVLALAAAAVFLARRPLQFVCGRFGREQRTAALAPLAALLVLAAGALFGAAQLAGWPAFWPLLGALPPALLFLTFDVRGDARGAAAELAGAAAFAVFPAACASLAGAGPATALALAALMLLRAVPAVLVVRTFLRQNKGYTASAAPALLTSGLAALGATALALHGLASGAALGVALLFLLRAVWLLGPAAPSLRAKQLGLLESALGVGFILAAGLG